MELRPTGVEGYWISDDGCVFSDWCRGLRPPAHDPKWRVALKPGIRNGYEFVVLGRNGGMRYVHRIVAEAFLGPCPEGQEVRHLDGCRTNNARSNLAYGTRAENVADTVRHGRPHGARVSWDSPVRALSDDDVRAIRAMHDAGDTSAVIAARFNISRRAAQSVALRYTRKDVA